MKRWRDLFCNERGTALALALIILVIMTGLAVGLATMGGVESRISASQSARTRARLLGHHQERDAVHQCLRSNGFDLVLLQSCRRSGHITKCSRRCKHGQAEHRDDRDRQQQCVSAFTRSHAGSPVMRSTQEERTLPRWRSSKRM